jgi:RHS repeat-associated protein
VCLLHSKIIHLQFLGGILFYNCNNFILIIINYQLLIINYKLSINYTYQYDELGRQIGTTDALQHSTRTEYDKLGNVTATVDLNGNRTEYTYDALNRRTQVKDAQNKSTYTVYDKVGNILSVTDALNRTTNYGYDELDRQTTRTDALNQTTTTTYNKVGNILTITDPIAGHTTSYGYDKLNRKTSTTDALNQTQTITYNILGNVSSSTDELGRTTNYEYDKVDRLTVTTDPLLHTTSTSYDTEGNVLTTTDAIGQTTKYLYDKNNRRTQVTDAKLGTTKTSYDGVGNVATITDSVNNTTTYGYDAVDRLITDTNQLGKSRTRSYDDVGNLTQTIDRNGRKVAYNYDTLNRQTSERWLDSNSATIKTFSASYDAVGHLIASTNPDAAYTYSYDAVDRVSSIDNTGTVGVPAVKFNYSYDAVGNLIAVNDSINGTNAGITGYTYDLLNRVTKLTQGGTGVSNKRVDMAYNAVNQLTGLSRFSGVNSVVDTSYVYDSNQRLIQLSHKKGASTVASYDYNYDNADKLASTISSVDGTSNYSYDSTNQLTGASHTAQTNEAYSYDANGNRTSGGTVTGVNNQLLSDGTYSYQYDGEGNRTKRTEIATGKVTEYIWDYRNRLASVLFKDAGGIVTKTIDYIYDGNNQRIGKRIDGAVVERYVIDRNQIALVFDGAGTQTHRYLYGTQVDQVLADETPTGMVWALADNQGTVKDLVDNSGVVVNHVTYDSFGKVVAQSNAGVEFRYGYTGREQDSETGLDYYRARYYDASNGRFISEDPIGFAGEDGNLTRYVGNSPVNYNDPSGLRRLVPTPEDSILIPNGLPGGGAGGGSRYNPSFDPQFRYQPSDLGTPNYGVPSNFTPTPGNNPTIFNPNEPCENQDKAKNRVAKDGLTNDKGCKYLTIFRGNNTRSEQFEQFVTKSSTSIVIYSPRLREAQIFDGQTPGTNYIWEIKSQNTSEAEALRKIYNDRSRIQAIIDPKNDEKKKLAKIDTYIGQKNKSKRIADDCGYKFRVGVRSEAMQSFLADSKQQGGLGYPYGKQPVVVEYYPWNP